MPKLVLINPIRRRRRKAGAKKRRRAGRARKSYVHVSTKGATMRRRRRSSRRRNPLSIKRALSNPIAVAKPALIGAAGALAVNGAVNYIPGIPDSLKTGKMLYLTKAALALLIATLGRRVLGANAVKMGEGALTVIATDLGKELAMAQGVNLAGVGFASPAMVMNRGGQPRLAAVRGAGMYVSGVRGVRGAGMYVRGR